MTSFVLLCHLTHFDSIGQNLHKLVNQRSIGFLTDTLINKLTLNESAIRSTRKEQPIRWKWKIHPVKDILI